MSGKRRSAENRTRYRTSDPRDFWCRILRRTIEPRSLARWSLKSDLRCRDVQCRRGFATALSAWSAPRRRRVSKASRRTIPGTQGEALAGRFQ